MNLPGMDGSPPGSGATAGADPILLERISLTVERIRLDLLQDWERQCVLGQEEETEEEKNESLRETSRESSYFSSILLDAEKPGRDDNDDVLVVPAFRHKSSSPSSRHHHDAAAAAQQLRASLRHWIDKLGSTSSSSVSQLQQQQPQPKRQSSSKTSKSTSSSRRRQRLKCLAFNSSCTREILQKYLEKVKEGDDSTTSSSDDHVPWSDEIRGYFLETRSPQALSVYQPTNGHLVEGQVAVAYGAKSCPNNSNYQNNETEQAILQCAGHLYDQLWWFRTLYGRDVSQALGFVVTATTTSTTTTGTTMTRPAMAVTLLLLQKPLLSSTNGHVVPHIGGRYQLYEHTYQQNINTACTCSSADNKLSWEEVLARFLWYFPSKLANNPFRAPPLSMHSAGCMLLPDDYFSLLQQQQHLHDNDCCWRVIPTLTGSLVIACRNPPINVVATLVFGVSAKPIQDEKKKEDDDQEVDSELARRQQCWLNAFQQINNQRDEVWWYFKYKTPVFGEFWETPAVAISGTRRRLQQQQSIKRRRQHVYQDENSVVREWWLHMHPIDTWIEPHRNVTVVRGMGTKFCGQLAWIEFRSEFLSLIQRTLTFQTMSQLVHGDIYEANIMFDKNTPTKNRLALIDWDEALRQQACTRQVNNDEECARYPNALVNFPQHYTQQQFLHLFDVYWDLYYQNDHAVVSDWKAHGPDVVLNQVNKEHGLLAAVDARFKALHRILQYEG